MSRDPHKARERKRRYLLRKKIEKYGPEAANINMSGRHGNHARGEKNARWQRGKLITSEGYVAVRVPPDHPHAWGPPGLKRFKYAYEHHVVMMAKIGRALLAGEVVHHRNGNRADNHPDNLELTTVSGHAREHASAPGVRDAQGRFKPHAPRVREFPEVNHENTKAQKGAARG